MLLVDPSRLSYYLQAFSQHTYKSLHFILLSL